MTNQTFNKRANAQILGAQGRSPLGKIVTTTMDRFSDGAWVGGRIRFDGKLIEFRPNALNRALHRGIIDFTIPIHDVEAVSARPGFISGIVSVRTADALFVFRCFGAKRVASVLDAVIK